MADLVPSTALMRSMLPEFSNTPEQTLAAHLGAAEAELNATVWGSLYAYGCVYLAASTLAATPFGQQAKLADQTGKSSYLTQFERYQRRVSVGQGRIT